MKYAETGKKISKLYGGALQELFTTNDNFLCEFPDGADLQTKVLFIAAAMMIEFTYVLVMLLRLCAYIGECEWNI